MRLNSLVTGLSRKRSGLALLVGLSTMLTGIERLLSTHPPCRRPAVSRRTDKPDEARKDYFAISQTRSEVGFVYWVLQGFGCYESFSLFDTWKEAVEEANRRVTERRVAVPEAVPQYAYASAALTH